MKKIKILLAVAFIGILSYGICSAHDGMSSNETNQLLLENVEAVTKSELGGKGYSNARNQYCAITEGKEGCVASPLRHCDNNVFCIR